MPIGLEYGLLGRVYMMYTSVIILVIKSEKYVSGKLEV